MYLDTNNLHGWAMSQPLPTIGFHWTKEYERLAQSISEHPADMLCAALQEFTALSIAWNATEKNSQGPPLYS